MIILVQAAGLVVIVGLFVMMSAGGNDRVYLVPDPERVAAIVEAFERVPPQTYDALAHALSDERLTVHTLPARPAAAWDLPRTAAAERQAADFRRALGDRPVRIIFDGSDVLDHLDEQPRFSPRPFRVTVGLPNGQAVEILRSVIPPAARLLLNLNYFLAGLVLYNLIAIFLVAAQSTVPLDRLIHAVRNDDPAQFTVQGPAEFVELGTAFRQLCERSHALLEERTRIIAAVAHDFRTYLTRLELRSDFIDDPEEQALARRDLAEMRELMEDALTFARPNREETGDDGIVDVVAEVRTLLYARRKAGEDVTLLRLGDECLACVTPVAFRRMVDNLLDNARRYGGGKASITIERRGAEVVLSIDDAGPGVPQAQLSSLTEPFMRLESSRSRHTGGVGLGLSIVLALAHRFDGNLELQNRAEGGLRARLTLRAVDSRT